MIPIFRKDSDQLALCLQPSTKTAAFRVTSVKVLVHPGPLEVEQVEYGQLDVFSSSALELKKPLERKKTFLRSLKQVQLPFFQLALLFRFIQKTVQWIKDETSAETLTGGVLAPEENFNALSLKVTGNRNLLFLAVYVCEHISKKNTLISLSLSFFYSAVVVKWKLHIPNIQH